MWECRGCYEAGTQAMEKEKEKERERGEGEGKRGHEPATGVASGVGPSPEGLQGCPVYYGKAIMSSLYT